MIKELLAVALLIFVIFSLIIVLVLYERILKNDCIKIMQNHEATEIAVVCK
jgi:hypothetical protein